MFKKRNLKPIVALGAIFIVSLGGYIIASGPGGAIVDFVRGIELNPDDADAYYSRGEAKFLQFDLDGAIVDFDRAIKLNPNHTDAYFLRGATKG